MIRALTLVLAMLALHGCKTLEGRATQFHTLDSLPRSFVVVPVADQVESLEFLSYAKLATDQLIARGWQRADPETADVAVFLQYQISQGRNVVFSYPIFGQVPTGSSTTTGSISTFGSTSTLNINTQQNTATGLVGAGVGSRVEYDRALQVTMYSLASLRENKKPERLYEATIRSAGQTGDLSAVVPVLIRGLFQEFPSESGASRKVSVPVK